MGGNSYAVEEHLAICERTQPKHPAATAQMLDHTSTRSLPQCYVFVDNSNVWITGQKVSGKKLKDVHIDYRSRVDLNRLLQLMVNGRNICQAYLYVSVPPPRKATQEKHFVVKTFVRSASGKETNVTVAMAHDMLTTLYQHIDAPKIIIAVTGDRDLTPSILKALDNGVPVELWSWEDAMAHEFCQLANNYQQPLFTASTLDSVQHLFCYMYCLHVHPR